MRYDALHSGVCCLLSALLTANNGLPLVLEHAHPVGRNLQHDFQLGPAVLLSAVRPSAARLSAVRPASTPPTGGGRSSQPPSGECSAAVLAVTPHIHLVWFGFEFTMLPPDSPGPEQDDSPSACGSLARMADNRPLDNVRLIDDGRRVDDGRLFGDESSAVVSPRQDAQAATDGLVNPSARRTARDVAALPLCDTARHERSGVQLI
jgi:hypothetical protein